jgi:polyphosphate kinase
VVPAELAPRPDGEERSIFDVLRERDVLVHHPYDSFAASVQRFVEEAAVDPRVLAIKLTLYRTSVNSPIVRALIRAADAGKQVAVLVEVTARFDEANNIEWARKLEDVGAHVAYGNPAQKIHAKLTIVVREEARGVRIYAHIGTGNYNSRTARVYTDHGLFTTDERIGADLLRVFNHLTGFAHRLDTQELLVAPVNLRDRLTWRIEREIEAAQAGRPARLRFKMNALEDPAFCRLLYEASNAGVEIDLIVRGICRLRPGVPGLSERIRVRSVIGRFLEHSRIYAFENAGSPEYFLGSADIMKRNLDERIEVLTPVHDVEHQRQLNELLELLIADERQAWTLHDCEWRRDPSVESPGVQQRLLEAAPFS